MSAGGSDGSLTVVVVQVEMVVMAGQFLSRAEHAGGRAYGRMGGREGGQTGGRVYRASIILSPLG